MAACSTLLHEFPELAAPQVLGFRHGSDRVANSANEQLFSFSNYHSENRVRPADFFK
jgi:hypothetical protein